MKQQIIYMFSVLAIMVAVGCGERGTPIEEGDVGAKKEALAQLESERDALDTQIKALEAEIAKLDTSKKEAKGILVATQMVDKKPFEHYIEVQGIASSRENVTVSAEMGGTVKKVLVKEGDKVRAGQTLVQLDASIQYNSLQELETALELAKTTYEKQKRLWDQKIGSEMQYLQAKNQKESLEKKILTVNAQIAKMVIKSPVNGTVDETFIRIGEMAGPGMPIARVVNLDKIYITADVSEAYIGRVKQGDEVKVQFPNLGLTETAKISSVGQYINPANRTFKVEVNLDNKGKDYKPNLLALIKIRDFFQAEGLVIPTKYIENVRDNHFVYVVNNKDGKPRAEQIKVDIAETYQGESLITSGLQENHTIVTEGFRDLNDGDILDIQQL